MITSPPYLNAIDYLRGHRMALVWLGYQLGPLRAIRADNIGSERAPAPTADQALATALIAPLGALASLPPKLRRIVERYALDLRAMLIELRRVLRSGGQASFVVGNSCLRGVFIENDRLLATTAEDLGFQLQRWQVRDLPAARRYLPPPVSSTSLLAKRMRTESVVTLRRP